MKQDWFRSLYFKTWIGGSLIAVAYMPLVTIFTRSDPQKVRPMFQFEFCQCRTDATGITVRGVHIPCGQLGQLVVDALVSSDPVRDHVEAAEETSTHAPHCRWTFPSFLQNLVSEMRS